MVRIGLSDQFLTLAFNHRWRRVATATGKVRRHLVYIWLSGP
jgi:hypothetical protein